MNKLRKFLSLTPGERCLLVSAFIWLVSIRLAHLALPFRTLTRLLNLVSKRNRSGGKNGLSPERISWAIEIVSHYLPGRHKCLVQALTAQVMLARRNYPAHLRIGVAKDEGGRLKAHAWVDFEGKVIIGKVGAAEYVPLPPLEI